MILRFSILMIYCSFLLNLKEAAAQLKPNNVTPGTYTTIFEMLRDVPGLEVKTSNDRRGGSIIVRGTGSLKSQNPPLFVLDGSIFNGDIANISPQDVDAISVLKDAASTTAYGAQGSAGVILITTKKGSGVMSNAVITDYHKSAYTYFIEHKTPLKVIGFKDEIIIEGVIQKTARQRTRF